MAKPESFEGGLSILAEAIRSKEVNIHTPLSLIAEKIESPENKAIKLIVSLLERYFGITTPNALKYFTEGDLKRGNKNAS